MYSWPDILTGLVRSEGLETEAATWALDEILGGRASEVQIAALLVALRAKGETEDEIRGLVQAMLDNAQPVALDCNAVDIVGTGETAPTPSTSRRWPPSSRQPPAPRW